MQVLDIEDPRRSRLAGQSGMLVEATVGKVSVGHDRSTGGDSRRASCRPLVPEGVSDTLREEAGLPTTDPPGSH